MKKSGESVQEAHSSTRQKADKPGRLVEEISGREFCSATPVFASSQESHRPFGGKRDFEN